MSTEHIDTDVVVLGAGPGGYSAAFRAADLGLKVTLVERYPDLGGVCLNVGCIPSKALLHVARVITEVSELRGLGLDLGFVPGASGPNLSSLRSYAIGVVSRLTAGLKSLAKQRAVRVVQGLGRFVSQKHLRVTSETNTTEIHFQQAIIAAGSSAIRPASFPANPRIWDSTQALQLNFLPNRLLIVGGGIIGLEMATLYSALGSTVTVVEALDRILADCDSDIVRPLQAMLHKRGVAFLTGTKVAAVEAHDPYLTVVLDGPQGTGHADYDAILLAVGRAPNGHTIGASDAGIMVTERGFIPVDDQLRTNVPTIFAIGDIAGPPMLAHKASHEGKIAAEVIGGLKSGVNTHLIPAIAYTDPEVAWVGVTESAAKARGLNYGLGTFPWAASGRSLGLGRSEGLTKLIFERDSKRLLGMAAVGPNAGDLIAEGTLALEMGCDAYDLALTIHPHPTLSETVSMAAEVFSGTVTDLYFPQASRH